MELFDPNKLKFDFTKYFKVTTIGSITLMIVSLIGVIYPGLNYGIDFRGGIEAHLTFSNSSVSTKDVRDLLESKLSNLTVVNFNEKGHNDFLITAHSDSKESVTTALTKTLTEKYGAESDTTWKVSKLDVVGRKVGSDFKKSALLSLIYTCLLVTLYMYWRFDMRFSPGALACIFHDLLLTSGFLVLTRAEFSTTVVAALLTLAGYSINDTVVVFDRIRETEHKFMGRNKGVVVNDAINSTLSRTIMTAGTTLVACAVLYFLGGPTLKDFSAALFFGIVVGTYSSAFVAAPLFIWADAKFGNHPKGAPVKA